MVLDRYFWTGVGIAALAGAGVTFILPEPLSYVVAFVIGVGIGLVQGFRGFS